MVDTVNLLPGGTLNTGLLNTTVNTLAEGINTNAASMDVFFILVSGYLVFLMQTVRVGTFFPRGPEGWRRLTPLWVGLAVCQVECVRCCCWPRLVARHGQRRLAEAAIVGQRGQRLTETWVMMVFLLLFRDGSRLFFAG